MVEGRRLRDSEPSRLHAIARGGGNGGLYCENARLEIVACIFRNNTCVKNGGAIYNGESGQLTIRNCRFVRNNALVGGGAIGNIERNAALVLENCTLTENRSTGSGGAILTGVSDPMLTKCTFERNSSARGGGIYNLAFGNPTLVDCVFSRNSATDFGGGMYNGSGSSAQWLLGCTFTHNTAGWYGGGCYNSNNARPTFENCLFVGNSSDHWGGALHFWKSAGAIRNCTIADNTAARGGALACGFEDQIVPSQVRLANCILWSNGEEIYNDDNSQIATYYCCIKGLVPGRTGLPNGNTNEDPCFVAPGRWIHGDDPNYLGPSDFPNPTWVDGDYHLKSQAGRWDPILGAWILDEVTSPCIDAGDPTEGTREEPMPHGGRINLGVYGGTPQASKSPGLIGGALAGPLK